MIDKKSVTEYVERVFELYGLDKLDFFYTWDDEDSDPFDFPLNYMAIPLFIDGFESEEDTIQRVSQHLGLTRQEIISCDKRAAFRYWDKYPYFNLHDEFLETWIWNANYKSDRPKAEEILIGCLFDINPNLEDRYNFDDVNRRFYDQLQEAAKFDQRYFPDNSYFHLHKFETQEMFSFPRCKEMVRSYLDMVYRVESLFFKAIKEDLPEEEQREYDFLVSFFNITDSVRPSVRLYYNEIVRLRKVFLEEGYTEFWSYARIRRSLADRQPWRCIEFFDDMELVQEFVNAFPSSKKDMIDFSRLVKNFRFTFQWEKSQKEKDEEYIQACLKDEEYDEDYNPNPELVLYVEKTPEESAGFQEGLEKLRRAASPPAMGGVSLPKREIDAEDRWRNSMSRLHRRLGGGKCDE